MKQEQLKRENDEIDLIEIFRTLWDKKFLIILMTFLITGVSAIYAFTAKEKWVSQAEISPPKLQEFQNYFAIKKELARIIQDSSSENKEPKRSNENEDVSKDLFGRLSLLLNSGNEKEAFLSQSGLYLDLIANEKDALSQRKILSKLAKESIQIIKPDPKRDLNLDGLKISFSAETPKDAQQYLTDFIQAVNDKTAQQSINDIQVEIQETINDLKYERDLFESSVKVQNAIRLDNLQNAYQTALLAGITDYVKAVEKLEIADGVSGMLSSDAKIPLSGSKSDNDPYLFMFGEKYLKAQIDSLQNHKVIYPQRYYQVQELLTKLELLLKKIQSTEVKIQSFSYQAFPDYPISRDKPKRAIILAFGFIAGLILSSLFVLGMNVFRKSRKDN